MLTAMSSHAIGERLAYGCDNLSMRELATRITTARKQAGLTMTALAALIGVSRAAVSQWESQDPNQSTVPGQENVPAVAHFLGIAEMELVRLIAADIAARPKKKPRPSAASIPPMPEGAIPVARTKIRKVWVVGIGEGGMPERLWTDGDYPVGASDRYGEVATDDSHAFIVQVRGDSMAPKYEPGGYALVLPSEPFESEDDVLVRLKSGETLLKKFVSRRGGVRLASYNPAHPTIMIDERDISWIYYVPHPMPGRMINEWVGECTYDPPTFDERGGHRPAKDKRRDGQS